MTKMTKPTKPNLPNQTKPTKPNRPNQSCQTKLTGQSSQLLGPQCLWQCLQIVSLDQFFRKPSSKGTWGGSWEFFVAKHEITLNQILHFQQIFILSFQAVITFCGTFLRSFFAFRSPNRLVEVPWCQITFFANCHGRSNFLQISGADKILQIIVADQYSCKSLWQKFFLQILLADHLFCKSQRHINFLQIMVADQKFANHCGRSIFLQIIVADQCFANRPGR